MTPSVLLSKVPLHVPGRVLGHWCVGREIGVVGTRPDRLDVLRLGRVRWGWGWDGVRMTMKVRGRVSVFYLFRPRRGYPK